MTEIDLEEDRTHLPRYAQGCQSSPGYRHRGREAGVPGYRHCGREAGFLS
jgi:hypothetical protein